MRGAEWLVNGCLRSVLGAVMIYFINGMLVKQGIDVCIGINAITLLTTGILGFPGLVALYGIGFYYFL